MSGIWNLTSICRFCHSDGNFGTFTLPNNYNGKLESYGDMLQRTFNITMTLPTGINASNMICDDCISSLKSATKFKEQVQACENKFQQYVNNEFFTLKSDVKDFYEKDVKIEKNNTESSVIIEVEPVFHPSIVKIEGTLNECEEFNDDDDNASVGNINYDESNTTNEVIIAKQELESEVKNNIAKKDPINIKSKNSKNERIRKNSIGTKIICFICLKNIYKSELLSHLELHKSPYNCKFCTTKFNKYDAISFHVQKEHYRNLYKCNVCNQRHRTEEKLLLHFDRHMRQNIFFKCDLCSKIIKFRAAMIRHIKTHDPQRMDKRYECQKCSWKFANSTNLKNHVQTVHEHIKNYHCTMCSKSFAAKKNLYIHIVRLHTNERPYECGVCAKKFKVLDALQKHQRVHQNKTPYKCLTCNVKFEHRGIYVDHLKTHPENLQICEQCGMNVTVKGLKRHILTAHNPPQFTCDYCRNMFKTKFQLIRHIQRKHLNIKSVKTECEICGKLVVDFKQHQSTHKEKRFACTLCSKIYAERTQLKKHMRVHGSKLYGCAECGKRFLKKGSLRSHNLKKHHTSDIYEINIQSKNSKSKKIRKKGIGTKIICLICIKNVYKTELLSHLELHKRPYNCKFCKRKFNKYDAISFHVQKEHHRNLYICNVCNQRHRTEEKLLLHFDRHMRQNIFFKCDLCPKIIKSRAGISRHIKTHDPQRMDKRYECQKCSWKFTSSTNLKNHIQTVHEHIKNYHCTMCSKSFAAKKSLHIHIRLHANERPYECGLCAKKFKVLDSLQKHQSVHQNKTQSYKCLTCNVKFEHRGIYVDHMKTHPENLQICEQCGMNVTVKGLKRHILTAHNPPQLTCDYCKNMFKTKLQLIRHIQRKHLNIKSVKTECEICGKLVVDFKQHQSTHKEKRFACTLCSKIYAERTQLKKHMRAHGSKLYGCAACGKKYLKKESLKSHNLKKHHTSNTSTIT